MAHTSYEDLIAKITEAKELVEVGAQYYHWRNPAQRYLVIALALRENDEEIVVIYQQMGVENPLVWDRALYGEDGWLTPATNDEGQKVTRFVKVEN